MDFRIFNCNAFSYFYRCLDIHSFFTLIIYAGLLGVNQEMNAEAGAGAWITFWKIELPFMMPYVLMFAVFRIIESFNQFDILLVQQVVGLQKQQLSILYMLTYNHSKI